MSWQKHKKIKEYLLLITIWVFFFLLILSQELKCLWNELTGLYCPGCGITRMLIALVQLDFYQAFRYNPLLFLLIIFGIGYSLYSLLKYKKIKKTSPKLIMVILSITILFGIIRNIPFFAFLAPTDL